MTKWQRGILFSIWSSLRYDWWWIVWNLNFVWKISWTSVTKIFNSVDGLCEWMASEIILFGRDLVTRTLVWYHNHYQGVTRTALKWKGSSTLHQDIGRFEATVLLIHTRICTFFYHDRLATDNLIFSQSRTNFVSWIVPHPWVHLGVQWDWGVKCGTILFTSIPFSNPLI